MNRIAAIKISTVEIKLLEVVTELHKPYIIEYLRRVGSRFREFTVNPDLQYLNRIGQYLEEDLEKVLDSVRSMIFGRSLTDVYVLLSIYEATLPCMRLLLETVRMGGVRESCSHLCFHELVIAPCQEASSSKLLSVLIRFTPEIRH